MCYHPRHHPIGSLSGILLFFILIGCGPSLPEEVASAYEQLPEVLDYNFHVQPILSNNCYNCHGPDADSRRANLRLDTKEGAFSLLTSGNRALKKGSLRGSELFHRIVSEDDERVMPPPESKLSLTALEKATLVKWIEQGAEWKSHWAFLPLELPKVPEQHPTWASNNEIDFFIQEPLQRNPLEPNPEADKERLLRRVTMDLTGLPPSLAEMEDFLSDDSPEAYEKVVDRLLETDAHAERLAMEWLDIARYADTHGVSFDGKRMMWPYRDWVIKAFKENLSFDEFIKKQVAGDLLPDAQRDDILATAFYRNNPMEASQGSIEEEYRTEYVIERAALTGTAFMGLTMGCARCHDHKFDPISQKEFYQLTAFFNSVDERGLGATDLNRAPTLLIPSEKEEQMKDSILFEIHEKEKALSKVEVEELESYISSLNPEQISGQIAYYPFDKFEKIKREKKWVKPFEKEKEKKKEEDKEKKDEKKEKEEDKEKKEKKKEYEEVYVLDGNKDATSTLGVTLREGYEGKGIYLDEEYDFVTLEKVGLFEHYDPFSVSLWINPDSDPMGSTQTLIGNSTHYSGTYRGWDLALDSNMHLVARIIHRLPDDYLEVRSEAAVKPEQWSQVGMTYGGSADASGINLFLNGEEMPLTTIFNSLTRSTIPINLYSAKKDSLPLRVGKSYRIWTGDVGLYKGTIDEVRIFDREVSALEMNQLVNSETADDSNLQKDHARLLSQQEDEVFNELKALRKSLSQLNDTTKEIMVMRDLEVPRKTYILERGLYNKYGEEVEPGTPEGILPFPEEYPKNRLGLAQWITHPDNPIVARVLINRYWQMLFGVGLVKTAEDFGIQGSLPTNPELLDWMARTFIDSDWDLRKMVKLMVMSATYKQSSTTTPQDLEIDPENNFYARSNSYRWPAEFIRDNALAASGLLKDTVGGPSVKPYQPKGLWEDLGYFSFDLSSYKKDTLDKLYRRTLYTFARRFSPHPFLINFDAPNREICSARRIETSTPLQALNLLNDPQFVEASRVLAERAQKESSDQINDQISYSYKLAVGMQPGDMMTNTLKNQFNSALSYFEENPNQADSLLSVGDRPFDKSLDKTRTAALTMVTNTIFNFDEFYMKR